MDTLIGFICCFSVFGGIIWLGIRFLTGITEYVKSAMAGENRAGAGVSIRSIGSASQLGQKVQLNYINSRGDHRIAFVDASTVHKHGDRVKVDRWGNAGTMNLVYERIKNPEVLGLISSNPVPEPEPLPPVLEQEEDGPPILHPKPFVLGNPSGPELLYVRRDGNRGVIYFEPTSIEIVSNRVNLNPKGIDKRYAIALDQIINPEILESHKEEEEEPPILGPKDTAIGDPSGKRLIYQRTDGRLGYIFFDPASVEIIGNRVNLKPKGIDKLYAIALDQIINPEVLTPEKEPEPEVIHVQPELEPITSTYEEGTRIVLDEIPLDSFEAVQVMRRIKPELGPFGIFDALIDKRETLLQGYTENQAKEIQGDLQIAGCTVSLLTVGQETGTAIAEPPPQPEVQEEPELPFGQPTPQTGRSPTKDEFLQIRSATEYRFGELKKLIESAPIDVNARDKHSKPLAFGVRSTKMLGLLMDRGADIHATDKFQQNALHHLSSLKPDVCEMLIQFGIDIDSVSQVGGETPLIRTASMGNYEITKILIEHGADINLKSGSGNTALDAALNNNWKDSDDPGHVGPAKGCEMIAALLRRHGAT